ncbi:protein B4 isoform X2 [Kryptolebias marmoratus]|uniref:protein B4 isoform X2 n=1 Tax=Kryptolebias marmoratus TaxID=37003 RepID=UPI0007F8CE54|nr:protein B4 isoform X2 [Kryptolebias marmoratus]
MPPKKPAADSADPPQPTSSKALVEETTESKKPDAATLRKLTSHPPTTIMVREALKALDTRKGVSSQAIQKYIKLKFPSADGVMLKHFVRRALIKGLETGTLARPPNSTTSGAQGRFRLAPKKESKPKSENTDPNVQKAPKVAKEGVKQSQKAGTTKKKNAADEENVKPPRKTKKDKEVAPAKRPKAKKAEAKGSGEGSADSSKSKATKTTKGPKTVKDTQSKAAKAGADAPVAKRGKKKT